MKHHFLNSFNCGWVEVIVGCMYSGKSEELIRQLKRAELAKLKLQVFKPKIDDRYAATHVASHDKSLFPSHVIEHPYEILNAVEDDTQVVGIDEAQFLDKSLLKVIKKLADDGKRVIIAGLDTDWKGEPFGIMPELMAVAEKVSKQYAICMTCGAPATRTQRIIANEDEILVGSHGAYEARCREHFDPELSMNLQKAQSQSAETALNT